ncbi:hypothetical protein Nepgr_003338 [Nepenthes gracilis]|uniref:Transcription factor CBF/NF-Y/archaeal histone domain-containing protein n=1 Tax=Nepenthes gracilis TaxID=150966 RepID=A0AAD3XDE3_NEPGR|nr:hypothetical protein Nepgr_003338 [Nepenthes gracilis]
MAEGEDSTETVKPAFPVGRVKKIVKLDRDISKLTSEALFLISRSAELFLQFLSERSAEVAAEKKRRIVKIEHLRIAVKRHQPTSDFLLDSFPPPRSPDHPASNRPPSKAVKDYPAPG